jgi:hypothetical protein
MWRLPKTHFGFSTTRMQAPDSPRIWYENDSMLRRVKYIALPLTVAAAEMVEFGKTCTANISLLGKDEQDTTCATFPDNIESVPRLSARHQPRIQGCKPSGEYH